VYNYRASRRHARKQIHDSARSENFHYRANFLQDWTISPISRRAARAYGVSMEGRGSGVTGDLLAHWH